MVLNFDYDSLGLFARQAYRTAVPGLIAKLAGFEDEFPIIDISTNGIAIKIAKVDDMTEGQEVLVEIMSVSHKKIISCSVLLVRIIPCKEMICCEFTGLSTFQEETLDRLVLEIQKREIKRKKLLREEANKQEDSLIENSSDLKKEGLLFTIKSK